MHEWEEYMLLVKQTIAFLIGMLVLASQSNACSTLSNEEEALRSVRSIHGIRYRQNGQVCVKVDLNEETRQLTGINLVGIVHHVWFCYYPTEDGGTGMFIKKIIEEPTANGSVWRICNRPTL